MSAHQPQVACAVHEAQEVCAAQLLAGLPAGPSKDKLAVVMPQATPKRIDLYFEPLVAGMRKYGITTPLRSHRARRA